MNQLLPIVAFKGQIVDAIADHQIVIIEAETGAGKSTQVPQYLLEAGYRFVVTEPRVLAARTVAERVAFERGEQLGGVVGYKTSRESKVSRDTKCLFCTDGLELVREIIGTSRNDFIVVDEVHEWNLNIEVLVAWIKNQVSKSRKFKAVLMSATMEADRIAAYFGEVTNTVVIKVPGRVFPVEEKAPGSGVVMDASKLVREGRNVLVFQPGKEDIQNCIHDITTSLPPGFAEILPLHGSLTPEEQAKCFAHYGKPKCIVSTNVAQTSVTIDDIDAVVDSGMEKRTELVDGIEGLYLRPISIMDSKQRKGRAGRTKPGVYIDHCPEMDDKRRAYPIAEINRSLLDQTVLRLLMAGYDMEDLSFFHQPDKKQIHAAKVSLRALGLIDDNERVTKMGRDVAKMPVSVQSGRMIVEADRRGVVNDIITIAALREVGDITFNPKGFVIPGWKSFCAGEQSSDLLAQLAVYKMAKKLDRKQLQENDINAKQFFRVREVERHLVDSLRGKVRFGTTGKKEDILLSICAGMVEHVYHNSYGFYKNGDATSRQLNKFSVVQYSEWIVGLPWDLEVDGRYGGRNTIPLIRSATAVEPKWLMDIAPQLIRTEHGGNPKYAVEHDQVLSLTQIFFRDQKIDESYESDENHPEAARVFAEWLASVPPSAIQHEALRAAMEENLKRNIKAIEVNNRLSRPACAVFAKPDFVEHYVRQLQGAKKVSELDPQKIQALAIPEVNPEALKRVEEERPSTIKVAGQDVTVAYPAYGSPKITITVEQLFVECRENIRLPKGGVVWIDLTVEGKPFSSPSVASLKRMIDAWIKQSAWLNLQGKTMGERPSVEREYLPEIIEHVYATSRLTDEKHVAYGVWRFLGKSESFAWTTFKPDAVRMHNESRSKFNALTRQAHNGIRPPEPEKVAAAGSGSFADAFAKLKI